MHLFGHVCLVLQLSVMLAYSFSYISVIFFLKLSRVSMVMCLVSIVTALLPEAEASRAQCFYIFERDEKMGSLLKWHSGL